MPSFFPRSSRSNARRRSVVASWPLLLLAGLGLLALPAAGCDSPRVGPDGATDASTDTPPSDTPRQPDVLPDGADAADAADGPEVSTVLARFDPDRGSHYFDKPYPSDDLLNESGNPVLGSFPTGVGVGSLLVESWVKRLRTSVYGFGLNTPIFFGFTGDLDIKPSQLIETPAITDAALLIDLDQGALHPVELKYLASAQGDPFLPDQVLIVAPLAGAPLRGGARYAVVITRSLKATDGTPVGRSPAFAAGFPPDAAGGAEPVVSHQDRLLEVLAKLKVSPDQVVSATAFSTQDIDAERILIRDAVDARLKAAGDEHFTLTNFQEVVRLSYTQGQTPSGEEATIAHVDYAGGGGDTWHMYTEPGYPPHVLELDDTFPMRVFEATINTVSLQGPADKPYASPGFALLNDLTLQTGRINFERNTQGGLELTSVAEPEAMRIVIQIPRTLGTSLKSCKTLVWDHGTGNSAYSAVSRIRPQDNGPLLAGIVASHGYCTISRDQPLYGKRFDLIDGGYDVYLAVYNIANLTAFRDNTRQAATDGYVLQQLIEQRLGAQLVTEGVLTSASQLDTVDPVKFGHSLGSVTSHMVLAQFLDPPGASPGYKAAFMSGSGGLLTLFFTEAGLGDNVDEATLLNARNTLKGLGVDLGEGELTAPTIIGALAGIPEKARDTNIDRLHPIMSLFQTVMDPADPINYAPRLARPETILMGIGDLQVPNLSTRALAGALPNETLIECTITSEYDPHSCLYREPAAHAVFDDFFTALETP